MGLWEIREQKRNVHIYPPLWRANTILSAEDSIHQIHPGSSIIEILHGTEYSKLKASSLYAFNSWVSFSSQGVTLIAYVPRQAEQRSDVYRL